MSSPHCIDIAIVNYFSATDVERCLQRIGHWPHGTLWLVDNSGEAQEHAALRKLVADRPGVTLIDAGGNVGFAQGCNLAFARSTSPYFLLLNPDAVAAPADLLALAEALEKQPRLAAVSPRIYWNDARTFLLPVAFPQTPRMSMAQAMASRAGGLAKWRARRYVTQQRQQMASQLPFEVDFVAGAVLMLRREAVLESGGLFDPDYFMFFEDSDLSLRLRRSGHALAIVPSAAAVHEYRHKAFKADMMQQSRRQYYVKHFPKFHRWTRDLSRLDRLAQAVPAERWFDVLSRPCRSLADFTLQAGSGGVVAFSPSMLMMPAIFRPLDDVVRGFSEEEWGLLEPATYVALLQEPNSGVLQRWVHFERIA